MPQIRTSEFRITVFTPTYNRAYTLSRVYYSLQAQTFKDFEWLIVDDGSTDDTEVLVTKWMNEQNFFPIRYLKKENGGKHTALNLGVKEARGEFFVIFDSDDSCVPQSFERFIFLWESIPAEQRSSFVGVAARCMDVNGNPLAKPFTQDPSDQSRIQVLLTHGFREYRWSMNSTDIMRKFPFPEFAGEKFVSESIVWNRIAVHYLIRFTNEVLQIKQQMSDGLVASYTKNRIKSPKSSRMMFQEFLEFEKLPPRVLLKFCLGYIRFSLHAGLGWSKIIKDSPKPFFTTLLFPFGFAIYSVDRVVYCKP